VSKHFITSNVLDVYDCELVKIFFSLSCNDTKYSLLQHMVAVDIDEWTQTQRTFIYDEQCANLLHWQIILYQYQWFGYIHKEQWISDMLIIQCTSSSQAEISKLQSKRDTLVTDILFRYKFQMSTNFLV
jgi:hypothetical protein